MDAAGDKVSVQLDAQIVEQTRAELGGTGEGDAAIIERALNAYLLARLLDGAQARSTLSGSEADQIAYDELHAARRERRGAA